MIDHFRTIALNVSAAGLTNPYTARNIHIDPSFASISLPSDLQALYNSFYPTNNLEAKLQLTQAYMSLIEGCGLADAMYLWDHRATYRAVREDEPANLRRISVGVPTTSAAQNPLIAVKVFNYNYSPGWLKTPLTRTLSIEQQTNTNTVQVLEGVALLHTATLVFSGGYSQVVTVPDPDNARNSLFDFQIKHPTSPAFTATSAKKWSVTLSINYNDLIPKQFRELGRQTSVISQVRSNYKVKDATSYDELWSKHFNEAYRLAGLYISMVYRMNAIRNHQNDAGAGALS